MAKPSMALTVVLHGRVFDRAALDRQLADAVAKRNEAE